MVCVLVDSLGRINNFGHWFVNVQRKEGGLIMGAIIMSVMVIVIAIVGYAYFAHQDRKGVHANKR
jgi:heme/copper-type cytochrome/quinol oxidase subunit 4